MPGVQERPRALHPRQLIHVIGSFVCHAQLEVRPSGLRFVFSIASVRVPSASGVRRFGCQHGYIARWRQGNRCIFVSVVCRILEGVRPSGILFSLASFCMPPAPGVGTFEYREQQSFIAHWRQSRQFVFQISRWYVPLAYVLCFQLRLSVCPRNLTLAAPDTATTRR